MEKKTSEEDKNKFVFFLGGHDAEMVTIQKMLADNNIPSGYIKDKNLQWGAKLSDYKEEIQKLTTDQIPIFIELTSDIEFREDATIIDHHNERAGKDQKTSIEQIADFLGVELNRWQQLISANDKGYIWGMQNIGATDEEIRKVREFDKKCQGVTTEDEEKAKISVNHFLERISNDMVIINSLLENTTTITELIYKYYKHIFIITPSKYLNYSGSEQIIKILKNKYALLKKEDSKIETWSGGYLPDHSFFGSNSAIDRKEIIKLMEPFVEKERIHSQHIFMFPFNIFHEDIRECKSSYNRLRTIHNMIEKNDSGWNYVQFKILQSPLAYTNEKGENVKREKYAPDEIWAYNEYKYFHEYVRDTLFNTKKIDELFPAEYDKPDKKSAKDAGRQNFDQAISLYYEREILPADEMVIFVRKDNNGVKEIINYTLKVEHISLRIFESGIGILSITLYNYCNNDFDSVLRINDFGRRIYPQFLGEQNEFSPNPIDAVKNSFLPEKIVFKASGIQTMDTFETDDYLSEKKHFTSYIEELLKPFFDSNKGKLAITPVIDDRMFVVCWHENDKVINELKKFNPKKCEHAKDTIESSEGNFAYEYNVSWYQYAFLDGTGPLVQNRKMKEELIKNVTYARFIESDTSTLYAITRYSFMCLCNVDGFLYSVIRNHMQKVYYQIAILLLAQRASILKFNKRLEKISEDADRLIRYKHRELDSIEEPKLDQMVTQVETLNKDIILFSSRMWFDEVSPQEQGIELYKLAIKNMDIEKEYISLREKVHQLHDFIRIILEDESTRVEQEKTSSIQRLTVASIVFAVVVCFLSFWAIDFNFLRYWKGIDTSIINTDNSIKGILAPIGLIKLILMFISSLVFGGSLIVLISLYIGSKLQNIVKNKVKILIIALFISIILIFLLQLNIIK